MANLYSDELVSIDEPQALPNSKLQETKLQQFAGASQTTSQLNNVSSASRLLPTVIVLQSRDEPPASPQCGLAWLSCLFCPCVLPGGLVALLCSACASCESDKQSRLCMSKCARGWATATISLGSVVFLLAALATLLCFVYPSVNKFFLNIYDMMFDPCSNRRLERLLESLIDDLIEVNPQAILGKLSTLQYCAADRLEAFVKDNWPEIVKMCAKKIIG